MTGGEDAPYGLLARFPSVEALAGAARRAREAGYVRLEAYSPIPVPEVAEALGHEERSVLAIALAAGIGGAAVAALLQALTALDFPFVVGGKPIMAWPPFAIVTFVLGVLAAVISAALAMLLLSGYPQPYHPLFNVPSFAAESADGFFLCVAADDPRFSATETRAFLERLRPLEVAEVPP